MREGERGVLSIYFQKKIKHLKIKQDVMLLLLSRRGKFYKWIEGMSEMDVCN